jgi:hypothetical protein
MISAQVEQVGCRDFDGIPQQTLTGKGRLRGRNRSLQQRAIPQAGQPAVCLQHLVMNRLDSLDRQVPQLAYAGGNQASRLNSLLLRPMSFLPLLRASSAPTSSRIGVTTMLPPG